MTIASPALSQPAQALRAARFVATGLVAFGVDLGILILLHGFCGVGLALSVPTAYLSSGIVHYGLTRFWVFDPEQRAAEGTRVLRYLLLVALNAAVSVLGVMFLVHLGLDYRFAKVICIGVLFTSNYVITSKYIMH